MVVSIPSLEQSPTQARDILFRETAGFKDDEIVNLIAGAFEEDRHYNESGICANCGFFSSPYSDYCYTCGQGRHPMPPRRRARWSAVRGLIQERGIANHPGIVALDQAGWPVLQGTAEASEGYPRMFKVKMAENGRKVEVSVTPGAISVLGSGIRVSVFPLQVVGLGLGGSVKLHGGQTVGLITGSAIALSRTQVSAENNHYFLLRFVNATGDHSTLSLMTRKSLWSGDTSAPWDFVNWAKDFCDWLPRVVRVAEDTLGVPRSVWDSGMGFYLTGEQGDDIKLCVSCGTALTATATRCTSCFRAV